MKSEKTFVCLHRFLIGLFILEVLIGLIIAIVCEYAKQITQNRIFQFDKHEALSVFFIVQLFGLHVSFYFLCGVPIVLLFNEVYTCHLRLLLKIWLLLAFETAIGALFMVWCFLDAGKFLTQNFEKSLQEGIKLYPHNPIWVLIWDDMQYDFKCCGIYSHEDWSRVNLTKVRRHKNDLSLLPFSCAIGDAGDSNSLNDKNIYPNGCYNVMTEIIDYTSTTVVSLNIAVIALLVRLPGQTQHKVWSIHCSA